jgi:hypothetical protein
MSGAFLIEHLPHVVLQVVEDLEVDGQVANSDRERPEEVGDQLRVQFVLREETAQDKIDLNVIQMLKGLFIFLVFVGN